MKQMRWLFVALIMSVSLHATAREAVAIVNLKDVPVARANGQPLTEAQVRQAIQNAANLKQWAISESAPGRLLATLHVRGKHTVVTEITYAADRYSLVYKDSINMKYGQKDGQPVIHPFYNRWVSGLNDGIQLAAGQL